MFEAFIFDFNGVLADDERVHMEAFRSVAAREGLRVTEAEYFERYLPFTDRELFERLFADRDRPLEPDTLESLVNAKVRRYYRILEERGQSGGRPILFPGAGAAVEAAARRGPLAIASGARREEIDHVLEAEGLRDRFTVVVAAEDVERGKPDPESFLKAAAGLTDGSDSPRFGACLAIEDSAGGILAAKAAGLPCLAVEHSLDRSRLGDADWVIPSIAHFGAWLARGDGAATAEAAP